MPPNRNAEVDSVRTCALIGICLVNVPFIAYPMEAMVSPASVESQWVTFFLAGFLHMKFFLLFSFLFGWGMGISSLAHDKARAPRYFSRLAVLALLGVAHGLLVFTGDILLLYAALGVLLWPLRRASSVTLLSVSTGLLCLAVITLFAFALLASSPDAMPVDYLTDARLGGSFAQTLAYRLAYWPGTLAGLVLLQGPMALAAFSAGLAAAKTRFFEPGSEAFAALGRHLPWLVCLAVATNLLYGLTTSGLWYGELAELLGFLSMAFGAPALTAVYLWIIVHVVRRWPMPLWLVRAGRNSLSSYVLQGVIAGWVFGGYGLGLFDQLSHGQTLAVSCLVALASLLAVSLWAQRFDRGPLEPALRIVK